MTEPLLIQKLNTQMMYLGERQTLLAKNIANIDTPNYRAQDLKKLDFDQMLGTSSHGKLPLNTTSEKHIPSSQKNNNFEVNTNFKAVSTKPGGNNVILEEQMGNVSDVQAKNEMATTLLRKYHQLYRIAVANKG